LVATAAVGALLQHGAANPRPFGSYKILLAGPHVGRCIAVRFRRWLAGWVVRSLGANIDIAIGHDCSPRLKLFLNAQ
jgi:hypothetical protein